MRGTVKQAGLDFKERFLRVFSWCLVKTVHRPKRYGPKPALDEPTIFACRHVGLMDPVILMVEYYRMMVRPLVAQDYVEKNGFTRKFYPIAQCIPIERRRASTKWLEAASKALEKGESVIIYPEGKRNKTGEGLLPFHSGAALLSARTGARIVPVWNAMWKFPHRYRFAIGEPFHLDPLPSEGESAGWLREQTKKVQDAVAALEPGKNPFWK